jgi:hypothetical protein
MLWSFLKLASMPVSVLALVADLHKRIDRQDSMLDRQSAMLAAILERLPSMVADGTVEQRRQEP